MVRAPRLPGLRLALLDMGRKTRIAKFRPDHDESQWFNHDRLEALQLVKLKELVSYAADNVPFYRALKEESGLDPESLGSLAGLDFWPVVGKTLMRRDPAAFRPKGLSPETIFTRRRAIRRTSGVSPDQTKLVIPWNFMTCLRSSHHSQNLYSFLHPKSPARNGFTSHL